MEELYKSIRRKKVLYEYIPMALTFIGILTCAIIFKQKVIKTIPVCVSLFVSLFYARANRLGFLLGGLNASIYIIGYVMEGLYGSILTTVFSVIIQLSSFFLWKKRAKKRKATVRKMKPRFCVALVTGMLLAWGLATFILYKSGGTEVVIDGLNVVLGFVIPILQMFGFIDVMPFRMLSSMINLVLWYRIIFIGGNIANLTYLISATYGFYMIIRESIRWISLYKKENAKNQANVGVIANEENR